jgi:tRNA/tmRNA/rRNA uracil-C5-methylase (TrmA/RlmC/RlmD family)
VQSTRSGPVAHASAAAQVADRIVEAFSLTAADIAVDLGCGIGQLTTVLAQRVGTVIGMDPEPDSTWVPRCRTA